MPRGIPKRKTEPDQAAPTAAVTAQEAPSRARTEEVMRPIRTREELDAERHTREFLKQHRPNLSGFEQKLAYYGEHPGWVRRWVVDHANRVQSLLENGWRFVKRAEVGMSDSIGHGNTDIGDNVSIVTTMGDGPVRQILMETTKTLFDMQCEASLERVRKTEDAIRSGGFAVNDSKSTYQPAWAKNRIETK